MVDGLEREGLIVFQSGLGWMSLKMRGEAVGALSFGHPSAASAVEAIAPGQVANQQLSDSQCKVVERLQRYATGVPVDFCDLPVDFDDGTEFRARVLKACREIPYGKTVTYGELAVTAGAPGAGRAVGRVMSGNRVPLIIPCHRVVRRGGYIGGYSAVGGGAMKRRLLKMEAVVNLREP
jgi:methylated-DNA-[protein]-cysteine S-methyltransferase